MIKEHESIILAAGKGSRLRPLTDKVPKCLVEVNSKPILEWQISLFEKYKIPINIISGYLNKKIKERKYNLKYFINADYDSSNMVYSLFKARSLLEKCINKKNIIISYGDIIYSPEIFRQVIEDDSPFSCVVDLNYKKYWSLRMDNIEDDLESLSTNKEGFIISIGQKINSIKDLNEIEAQYIGLIKISSEMIPSIIKRWDEILNQNLLSYSKDIFMTEFLQYCINTGLKLKALKTSYPWAEIDTPSDINIAEKILKFVQFPRY